MAALTLGIFLLDIWGFGGLKTGTYGVKARNVNTVFYDVLNGKIPGYKIQRCDCPVSWELEYVTAYDMWFQAWGGTTQ